MERIPKGIYTQEFRVQAVRLHEVEARGGRRLSLPGGTLKNWAYAARRGKLAEAGKNQKPLTELEMELARVKRELAEVKMGREILKKAAAYFAKESR